MNCIALPLILTRNMDDVIIIVCHNPTTIFYLTCSCLRDQPAELSEIAVDRDVFLVLLGCCSGNIPQRKSGH